MSATGFQTTVNADVVLTVGARASFECAALKVGDVAQKVVGHCGGGTRG